mmetsp:Transcript_24459/g.92371  ORF Transcript_24459/g.92371 Transcript_24459/m.92371 type:complete len:284 (-) Transcript_24459:948-1799(-)
MPRLQPCAGAALRHARRRRRGVHLAPGRAAGGRVQQRQGRAGSVGCCRCGCRRAPPPPPVDRRDARGRRLWASQAHALRQPRRRRRRRLWRPGARSCSGKGGAGRSCCSVCCCVCCGGSRPRIGGSCRGVHGRRPGGRRWRHRAAQPALARGLGHNLLHLRHHGGSQGGNADPRQLCSSAGWRAIVGRGPVQQRPALVVPSAGARLRAHRGRNAHPPRGCHRVLLWRCEPAHGRPGDAAPHHLPVCPSPLQPHPRQDQGQSERLWRRCAGALRVCVRLQGILP